MRVIIFTISTIIALLLLSGCGGGGSTSVTSTTTNNIAGTSMILGKTILVSTGDKIIPTSDDAQITIQHNDDGTKYATLTSGSANVVQ